VSDNERPEVKVETIIKGAPRKCEVCHQWKDWTDFGKEDVCDECANAIARVKVI